MEAEVLAECLPLIQAAGPFRMGAGHGVGWRHGGSLPRTWVWGGHLLPPSAASHPPCIHPLSTASHPPEHASLPPPSCHPCLTLLPTSPSSPPFFL